MKMRLTKTSVEAIEPEDRDTYAWDERVAAFGVKVTPAGARVYIIAAKRRGAVKAAYPLISLWTSTQSRAPNDTSPGGHDSALVTERPSPACT
jgi:hypothetical protein